MSCDGVNNHNCPTRQAWAHWCDHTPMPEPTPKTPAQVRRDERLASLVHHLGNRHVAELVWPVVIDWLAETLSHCPGGGSCPTYRDCALSGCVR